MSTDDKEARIVAARMRLKERFEARMQSSPALADEAPQGSGPPNRHGMPQVPPGQHLTDKWPVLDLGRKPEIARAQWQLRVVGSVARPQTLRWDDFMSLEQVDDVSDFHCVTTWSKLDVPWTGVRFAELAALVEPHDDAAFVLCRAYDGYTTNLPLHEALKPDVLIAHSAYGEPLPREHGGPARMITPQLYAWKGAKWIETIEFRVHDETGFWEDRGYSNTAHPWRNDRYS